MINRFLTLTLASVLTGCVSGHPYPPLSSIDYAMGCKQIQAEINKTEKNLAEVKQRRATVTNEDIGGFILDFGAGQNMFGAQAQKAAEDRLITLHEMAQQRRCTIKSSTQRDNQ